jgi:hypothetical protein
MDGFLHGLERSLAERNWHAALVMSLTLPDICVKASDLSQKTTGAKYAAWFNEFVGPQYTRPVAGKDHVFLSGRDCYALRSALLHEGSDAISSQKIRETLDRFHFCTPGALNNRWHLCQKDTTLLLMIDEFAGDLLAAGRAWWEALDPAKREAATQTHLTFLDSDHLHRVLLLDSVEKIHQHK